MQEKIDQGDLVKAQIYLKPLIITSMTWSSQEWKTDIETYERSGRPDKLSCRMIRKVRLGFSHEETHHDGTAQSVVNEVMPRDRPGRPDIDSREEVRPQQFGHLKR